jgi:predicted permease
MNEILLSILATVLGAVVTVWIGGFLVGRIVSPYADQLDADSGLQEGGRLIGYCERLLIYVFVLANAPSAIGFLVTAKSLFRFGEVTGAEKRRHAEYVIIGTLVSFAYAVTLSYLVRWALDVLS